MPRLTVHALGAALAATALLAGCDNHYSTQEAYEICEEHRSRNPGANTDESFAACVACYEDCGSDCVPGGGIPMTYGCPD